jgi:hypothetical protein
MKTKKLYIILTLTVVAIIILPLLNKAKVLFAPTSVSAFNRHAWLNAQSLTNRDNPRIYMVDDLLNHHIKAGIDKSEIIKLLGSPNDKTRSPQYEGLSDELQQRTVDVLVYDVGVTDPFPNAYKLIIGIDKSHRVTVAWYITN